MNTPNDKVLVIRVGSSFEGAGSWTTKQFTINELVLLLNQADTEVALTLTLPGEKTLQFVKFVPIHPTPPPTST